MARPLAPMTRDSSPWNMNLWIPAAAAHTVSYSGLGVAVCLPAAHFRRYFKTSQPRLPVKPFLS